MKKSISWGEGEKTSDDSKGPLTKPRRKKKTPPNPATQVEVADDSSPGPHTSDLVARMAKLSPSAAGSLAVLSPRLAEGRGHLVPPKAVEKSANESMNEIQVELHRRTEKAKGVELQKEASPEPAPAVEPWTKIFSQTKQKYYWKNSTTHEKTWKDPFSKRKTPRINTDLSVVSEFPVVAADEAQSTLRAKDTETVSLPVQNPSNQVTASSRLDEVSSSLKPSSTLLPGRLAPERKTQILSLLSSSPVFMPRAILESPTLVSSQKVSPLISRPLISTESRRAPSVAKFSAAALECDTSEASTDIHSFTVSPQAAATDDILSESVVDVSFPECARRSSLGAPLKTLTSNSVFDTVTNYSPDEKCTNAEEIGGNDIFASDLVGARNRRNGLVQAELIRELEHSEEKSGENFFESQPSVQLPSAYSPSIVVDYEGQHLLFTLDANSCSLLLTPLSFNSSSTAPSARKKRAACMDPFTSQTNIPVGSISRVDVRYVTAPQAADSPADAAHIITKQGLFVSKRSYKSQHLGERKQPSAEFRLYLQDCGSSGTLHFHALHPPDPAAFLHLLAFTREALCVNS